MNGEDYVAGRHAGDDEAYRYDKAAVSNLRVQGPDTKDRQSEALKTRMPSKSMRQNGKTSIINGLELF